MSAASRLISAGLPAPSAMTTSYRRRRSASESRTVASRAGLCSWYSAADRCPTAVPRTMTWLVRSPVGLRRMGFMAASGTAPAARAWTP